MELNKNEKNKDSYITQNLTVWCLDFSLFYLLFKSLDFIKFLKFTFHLQLLQNIGYISHVVQYIPEPILYLRVCPLTPPHINPAPSPMVTTSSFFVSVSLLFFCYSYLLVVLFRFHT